MPPRQDLTVAGSADDYALRDFLTRIDQSYTWLEEGEADAFLTERGVSGPLPVIAWDGQTLVAPSLDALADALGIRYAPTRQEYDLLVVGAGPAGLAAAVYAASDGLSVAVAEASAPGGQAAYTSRIENFFGIDPNADPMTGAHLARIGGRQAETFGAELLILRGAAGLATEPDGTHRVDLATGEAVRAPVVLCATGVEWRHLEVDGVDELIGRGVYYGAGRGEAARLAGRAVAIVGAGNSAGQAALNLADHGARVTMLCRGPSLGASLSRYLVDRILAHDDIDVRMRTEITAVRANGHLRAVELNGSEELALDAVFVAIGGTPCTAWAGDVLVRDPRGYVYTGTDLPEWSLERPPFALETSVPGVFAAGDIRHGSTKRVAAAVGEGSSAVEQAHRYLEGRAR
jgi:thioredoxin reductase (NADPH)